MTRYVLRKGFSLRSTPGGGGQLTDGRTGDTLVLSERDFAGFTATTKRGEAPGELLERFAPFLVEARVPGFHELDIEDASSAITLSGGEAALKRALEKRAEELRTEPEGSAVVAGPQSETVLARGRATTEPMLPQLEVPAPSAPTIPGDATLQVRPEDLRREQEAREQPTASGRYLSQEENLQRALGRTPPEPSTPSVPEPQPEEPPMSIPSSGRGWWWAAAGLLLLIIAISVTLVLAPRADVESQVAVIAPTTVEPPVAAVPEVDAGIGDEVVVDVGPTTVKPTAEIDAGVAKPAVVMDAGAEAPVAVVVVDAGIAAPVDAGRAQVAVVAPAVVDAGVADPVAPVTKPDPVPVAVLAGPPDRAAEFFEGAIQARGRVKMGEIKATADGQLQWNVDEGQRIRSKQTVGTITGTGGAPQSLQGETVGLLIRKTENGPVKRGAVLAEIIYFEAWARATVKNVQPELGWKCVVVSDAKKERADCKVSVVAAKGKNAQVTIAVEPRWFDDAQDAVVRVSAP